MGMSMNYLKKKIKTMGQLWLILLQPPDYTREKTMENPGPILDLSVTFGDVCFVGQIVSFQWGTS